MKPNTDFLIIGSGIAGLTYAIKVAVNFPGKNILIVTKNNELESNTRYAQGGIAAVLIPSRSEYQSHCKDTLIAGDYLNNPDIVDLTVKSASERIEEIIAWGTSFDKNEQGEYDLCLEGGHSQKRILHHKDITGLEIQRTLLNKIKEFPSIKVLTHFFAKDLIIHPEHSDTCIGAQFLNIATDEEYQIFSEKTIVCTGGIGQVYKNTTNPLIATGDGIAMAARAGAAIENMEFIQFHPTALFSKNENPSFLISEAVRGTGAELVNHKGIAFMKNYSSLGSLAPRDIVARAIEHEIKKEQTEHVYLDCTKIPTSKFKDHFPNIYHKCHSIGIEPDKNPIPVVPAAHYLCGGIKTNQWGQSSIKNLYAIGECASTGLHGANRLASNSLLEALVFAHQAYLHSTATMSKTSTASMVKIPFEKSENILIEDLEAQQIKEKINTLMTNHAGIVRNTESILTGIKELNTISETIEALRYSYRKVEILNLAKVAELILKASLQRKENKGLHYNTDFV
jgi:L-aspartate oxidase